VRRTTTPARRDSLLDPYLPTIRKLLDDTPEMRATAVLERLRPLGYSGGITIVRDRLRRLRPRRDPEAFLTLHFPPASAITTNRPFKDWTKVFPDPLNAQIIAERLTERSEHFVLEKGYRPKS
jgi:hypothetical protein